MSETANVRLVRCPKCENLLPEVTDYSVYQCGGCGAVLRAKNKGVDLDILSEKSDEEKNRDSVEKPSDRFEKMVNGSDNDMSSNISSSSRGERRMLHDMYANKRTSLTSKEDRWEVKAGVVHKENEYVLRRPGRMLDGWNGETYGMDGFWRVQRTDGGTMDRMKESPYDLPSRSIHDNEDGFSNFDDRAELFKKLDELQDQLRRSGNLMDKGKEKVFHERRMAHQDPYASEDRVSMKNSYPSTRLLYQNQHGELHPLMHRQETMSNGLYPLEYAPHVPGYEDPSKSRMSRRGPALNPRAYKSGPYMDDGMVYMDNAEPHPMSYSRHHPSCSCYQCHHNQQAVASILPAAYSDGVVNDRMFSHRDNPGSRDYNLRLSHPPPLIARSAQSLARWPSDVDSEADALVRHRPRVSLPSSGKHCCPVAGGAPFFTCFNCFELLLLSKKLLAGKKPRNRVRCGVCSMVIVFIVSDKNLVVSTNVEEMEDALKVDKRHGVVGQTTFSSDYDDADYDFHSMDRQLGQVSTDQGRSNKSKDMKNSQSTSSYTSEAEDDWENLTAPAVGRDSSSTKSNGPTPAVGSSLQDHFEYSNKYHAVNRSGEGNRSGRSEHEKVVVNKTTARQISRNESSATEMDLSSSEFNNTGTTFDSGEASRERDHLKISRAAESFFGGIIKKSYKDSSNRSNETFEQEKASVTVNGHLIPEPLIKKAEKVAGPISAGHYWYDFRAGFWGAVGGPCLGIIPPFIEEFNYPMREQCAGGNTHVFVNGRELNHKDLNLLGSRGLPRERGRSYIIEISGRILDEEKGEELQSLGKLAPTVERLKRGFGMRAPKEAAAE